MCFSAQVVQSIRDLERRFGATADYGQFELLLQQRLSDKRIRIKRAFDANFADPHTSQETRLHALIAQHRATAAGAIESELFKQKTRLTDTQRDLSERARVNKPPTKKALNDQRIATDKVASLTAKLTDLRRRESKARDSRIFPMDYAPIIIKRDGVNMIQLARYHCRQPGKPSSIDKEKDGLYNARRDNLTRYWRNEFNHSHALMVVNSFFENVEREGKNAVLHFTPGNKQPMLVACLYADWRHPEEGELLSFAAVTDEPPDEIRAAGHDRVIINLQEQHVETWLSPQGRTEEQLQEIMSDQDRPYYEHEMAA